MAVFSLSSFNTRTEFLQKSFTVYFHCNDGHAYGLFQTTSSDPEEWQRIANALCNM